MKVPSWWSRCQAWAERNAISLYALALTVLLASVALAPSTMLDVPAGHVGVLWRRFAGGTVTDHVLDEGMHIVPLWDKLALYDLRLHNETRTFHAIASNGMSMSVDIAIRFRVNPPEAGLLHKLAGPAYAETLVYPLIASLVYEYVSDHTPEQFYSKQKKDFEDFLMARAGLGLAFKKSEGEVGYAKDPHAEPLVLIDGVMLTSVVLPSVVSDAIEHKIEQQQIMQEYDFRIEREKKERERKRIEAEGIRAFQDTVARTITSAYLRLRGIEATQAFADSSNAKTIIIGGRDGLPVILNTGEDLTKAPAPEQASPAAKGPVRSANGKEVPPTEGKRQKK